MADEKARERLAAKGIDLSPAHPVTCACKGTGYVEASGFVCGYERCTAARPSALDAPPERTRLRLAAWGQMTDAEKATVVRWLAAEARLPPPAPPDVPSELLNDPDVAAILEYATSVAKQRAEEAEAERVRIEAIYLGPEDRDEIEARCATAEAGQIHNAKVAAEAMVERDTLATAAAHEREAREKAEAERDEARHKQQEAELALDMLRSCGGPESTVPCGTCVECLTRQLAAVGSLLAALVEQSVSETQYPECNDVEVVCLLCGGKDGHHRPPDPKRADEPCSTQAAIRWLAARENHG